MTKCFIPENIRSARRGRRNAPVTVWCSAVVPFAIGKPATFSAWMKPGKPSKVEFMLFSAAGSAYIKTFNAGTERTKYSFPVPSFGAKNMAGALTIGEPAKRPAVYLNPCITLEKSNANTV